MRFTTAIVLLGVFLLLLNHPTDALAQSPASSSLGQHAGSLPIEFLWFRNQDPRKYFHESLFSTHYDIRFGTRYLNYDERHEVLRPQIQMFLTVMDNLGIDVVLMHGTLLGWWWNGRILPWDDDIDVMITETSLSHLAKHYSITPSVLRPHMHI